MNTSESPAAPKSASATWAGLFIALFGLLIVRWAVSLFYSTFSFTGELWKEGLIWLCVIALIVIMKRGEGLSLRSVHLGTMPLKKSLIWGAILTLLCGLVGGIVSTLTHFNGGESGAALARFPLWLVVLIVLRAGVVEELFYRGYAIERLQALGLHRYLAGAIPLLIFGFGHWTNGWANVVLALGALLTLVYLWRRDLVANMIGYFMIDFISVALPRMLVHS